MSGSNRRQHEVVGPRSAFRRRAVARDRQRVTRGPRGEEFAACNASHALDGVRTTVGAESRAVAPNLGGFSWEVRDGLASSRRSSRSISSLSLRPGGCCVGATGATDERTRLPGLRAARGVCRRDRRRHDAWLVVLDVRGQTPAQADGLATPAQAARAQHARHLTTRRSDRAGPGDPRYPCSAAR